MHSAENVKENYTNTFREIIDNLMPIRNSINDDIYHHFALFFKHNQLKWCHQDRYGGKL